MAESDTWPARLPAGRQATAHKPAKQGVTLIFALKLIHVLIHELIYAKIMTFNLAIFFVYSYS